MNCDIQSRVRTKRILKAAGAERVVDLDEILNAPVNVSGFNAKYGLLGSNKSTEDMVKRFPQDCFDLVDADLIGSLCDLTSGSGDKGTPIVLVQGYFDNLTD